MQIRMVEPSPMGGEMEVLDNPRRVFVTPCRFSKAQRKVMVIPFETVSSTNKLLDKGFIGVDSKTGKLFIEHQAAPVPFEVDEGDVDKSVVKKGSK